jgi:glycosyltransferase involved in cell wall biosynthesis
VNVLFLHDNFPGQFRHLAPRLAADPANRVVFGTRRRDAVPLPGVRQVHYEPARRPGPATHAYVRSTEEAVLTGQAVVRMATGLARQGFRADVVVAHSGWGPGLFVKEVFPDARVVNHIEWYYRPHGTNLDFLPDESLDENLPLRVRTANAAFLLDLAEGDWAVTPTAFQAAQLPAIFRQRLTVLHEGIDTDYFAPAPTPGLPHLDLPGLRLPSGTELVTYATRGMEPYRGFPQFLRAVDLLLRRRPRAHAVIAGEERVAYGTPLPEGESWKTRMLAELDGLDLSRVHFVGPLPYRDYRQLLRASAAHVYLTVPFVLSWSMLEAMSCGCLLLASATPPVQEMVEDGTNGLLVDFFDHERLAATLDGALEHPTAHAPLRAGARATILERYDVRRTLPRHVRLVEDIAAGRPPR